jgi:hypothetical protein
MSYHIIFQEHYRPLKKEFVNFNICSISHAQNFKHRRYKCILQICFTILPDHDVMLGPHASYVCIENLCLYNKIHEKNKLYGKYDICIVEILTTSVKKCGGI